MMKTRPVLLIVIMLLLNILACSLPGSESIVADEVQPVDDASESMPGGSESQSEEAQPDAPPPISAPSGDLPPIGSVIQPEDLEYLGAFRLPEPSGGSDWDYSGHALTYYPGGDLDGPADGFPGSLFGVGHDQNLHVSEINIPAPVVSKNPADLPTAVTLQPFGDITGGRITEDLALPRLGLEVLPAMGAQTSPKLHFTIGQHIQSFEPSHGWAELDLSNPQPAGMWVFNGYSNYTTNDYIFEIPEAWAEANTPGLRLASGRFREGVWGGGGPALFAYGPWNDGNPPGSNSALTAITPLLLFGIQEPDMTSDIITMAENTSMDGYQESDHWLGSAWLTAGERGALIFTGTKALGESWYGFANGVVWDYECAEQNNCPDYPEWPYDDRGFWAEEYQAQIIFFSPDQLAAVARGEIATFQPQPYAVLNLNPYLLAPELDFANYKRDLVAAAAFDRESGLLYVIERLADEYRSVIHVWRVN